MVCNFLKDCLCNDAAGNNYQAIFDILSFAITQKFPSNNNKFFLFNFNFSFRERVLDVHIF